MIKVKHNETQKIIRNRVNVERKKIMHIKISQNMNRLPENNFPSPIRKEKKQMLKAYSANSKLTLLTLKTTHQKENANEKKPITKVMISKQYYKNLMEKTLKLTQKLLKIRKKTHFNKLTRTAIKQKRKKISKFPSFES